MRSTIAISFLLLLLFHLFGYRMLLCFAEQQANRQLEATLDRVAYPEASLITITVPITVPYQADQMDFERVDGEIRLNGKLYKFVKRKIAGGQLVLLCLPDHQKMRLEKAGNDFVKNNGDAVQANGPKKPQKSAASENNPVHEYVQLQAAAAAAVFTPLLQYGPPACLHALTVWPGSTPEQPPEMGQARC